MRITGGKFRGRTLRTPRGEATRPTSGRARETLFNILAPDLPDARMLDLFAGCGSVGLEAASRGAARAVLVEKARPALQCLRENVEALSLGDRVAVLASPVERALSRLAEAGEQFDILFLDPPFGDERAYIAVLEKIAAGALLAPEGVVVAQHDARMALPEHVGTLIRARVQRVGDNALTFFRRLPC